MSNLDYREEVDTNMPTRAPISWGAIFAGTFAMLATSWLLYLLGTAIGVSVADASDDTLMDDGMPQAVALWMVLSAGVAYFIGSALAARLAGTRDDTNGMLHGMTVWSVATVATVILGYYGISGVLQAGQSALSTATSAAGNVAAAGANVATTGMQGVATGVQGVASGVSSLSGTELAETIRTRLKRQVAQSIASADQPGGTDVSEADIREAINSLDAETLDQLAAQLADNNQQSASELVASETSLTAAEAEAVISGAYQELEEQLGNPDNDANLATELRRSMANQSAKAIAAFDAKGGENVSSDAIQKAINDLNNEQFQTIASKIVTGNYDEARDLIVEETNLSRAKVNEIVEGVRNSYQSRIDAVGDAVGGAADEVAETASEAVEVASTYAQQVLWAAFATTALGLGVSLLGGWCGADTSRRLYYEVHEKRVD